MSGPKCSMVELSGQRMREYEERLRRQQERIRREEAEKRKRLEAERRRREAEEHKKIQQALDEFDAEVERMLQEMEASDVQADSSEEVVRLEQELLQLEDAELQAEEEFAENCHREVCRVIDETIEEMGYHIIGERADGQATSKLYQYDGNTAIHVTDVGGQFTMEVVAMDTVDRPATAAESGWLAGAMQHFCGDYSRLRDRLEAKELVFARDIYHLPPSPEHAKVVNTSDYEMRKTKNARKVDADYEAVRSDTEERLYRR